MATTITRIVKSKNCRIPLCYSVFSAATAIFLLFHSTISSAAEWKIAPSLDLKETYSDNITLATPGNEKSDFVTQINPGISITGSGPRLKVNARYIMQNRIYANEGDRNATSHLLNAGANAELLDDFLFLDSKASISQQNFSTFGPQTAPDDVNITENKREVRTLSISPYVRHRFADIASSELRFTHDEVSTSSGGLSDSTGDRVLLTLNSGNAFQILGWGLSYNKQKIDYSGNQTNKTQDIEFESLSGNLRYLVTTKFSLKATAGHEKNNYLSLGNKSEGPFWSTGFVWTPFERSSIEASAGKRFFGDSYSLTAKHSTRMTIWSLKYSDEITTTRSQFLVPETINTSDFLNQLFSHSVPDPALRQQMVEAIVRAYGLPQSFTDPTNYFTNRVFLQKRLQASVAINGTRNSLILSLFNMTRDAQTAATADSSLFGTSNFLLNDSTKQTGANALWNMRFSPLTSANMSLGYVRSTSLSSDRQDNTKTLRLGLVRNFKPKLNGVLDFRHVQRDTNQLFGDYRENAITASVHMSF